MNQIRTRSIPLQRGKTVIGRILPGTDLICGIENICRDNRITSGSIVSAIGTLVYAELVYVVPEEKAKLRVKYVEPTRVEGPLELLASQGMVGLTKEKRLSIHLHAVMSAPDMKVYGGHLVENGNPVLATAEVMIQEYLEISLVREHDSETGFTLFKLYPQQP
ncbi:MAG: DNA-binding protein [Desulfobacterales bacterium]|jgi:predicted DNA-binding protein with PD1-like motif